MDHLSYSNIKFQRKRALLFDHRKDHHKQLPSLGEPYSTIVDSGFMTLSEEVPRHNASRLRPGASQCLLVATTLARRP